MSLHSLPPNTYLRRRLGLTILELIVAIVVLGVLSAIAIPTFLSVIDKSKTAAAQQTLEAFARDAWANAALTGGSGYTTAAVDAAAADTPVSAAAGTGILAEAGGRLLAITGGSTKTYGIASVVFATPSGRIVVGGTAETEYIILVVVMPDPWGGGCIGIEVRKGGPPKLLFFPASVCTAGSSVPGLTTHPASGYTPTTPGGTTTTTTTTTPAPSLTGISPNAGLAAGGTSVVLTGTGFSSGDTVRFGATPAASMTVTAPTTITAVAPAHAPGTVTVTVVGPGGAASQVQPFTYYAQVSVVAESSASSTTTHVTVPRPAPYVPGDYLYAFLVVRNGTSGPNPAGWEGGGGGGAVGFFGSYSYYAPTTTASGWEWTTRGGQVSVVVVELSGVTLSKPTAPGRQGNSRNSTVATFGSIQTTYDDQLVFYAVGTHTAHGRGAEAPSGTTFCAYTSGSAWLDVSWLRQPAAGTVAARSLSLGYTTYRSAIVQTFRPKS